MSSVLFQMMRMYGSLRTQREVAMLRGPPLSCKMSFLARLLLSESCESYWSSANGSLFWHLNPLSVIASLLAELLGAMGAGVGGFAGGFVRSLLDELPWIYHLPALVLVLVALLTAIAFAYGYQFVIGYGLIRVSPAQSAKYVLFC
ncbi:hypothetical protein AAVH_21958 [Aphelenchoides avenae]|nr:hypothetical protein AAVH_21958 [Aphelenchus avenae]